MKAYLRHLLILKKPAARRLGACVGLIVALCLCCGPAVLADGTQTGLLRGVVVDAEGLPLPGVDVTAQGEQFSRDTVTDTEGAFFFPALEVGVYRVEANLLQLRTVHIDARVFIDRPTEIRLTLRKEGNDEPVVETGDVIQVSAVAPLINRYDTRVGGSVSREFLDDLPVQRFYQSAAFFLPGLVDLGDGNPNVGGALRGANLYLVDGVDTTDATTGLFGLNLTFEAIADVDVSTAVIPAEYGRVSGAVINVVTRSGGNDFQGGARWLATSASWRGDYKDPSLTPDALAASSGPSGLQNTFTAFFSGPLAVDRMWFFAGFEGSEDALRHPTLDGAFWDEAPSLRSGSAKITAALGQRHTLQAQFTADSGSFATYIPFDSSPGENRANRSPRGLRGASFNRLAGDPFAAQERSQEGDLGKLQWQGILGANFTLSANAAIQSRLLERSPISTSGFNGGAPHIGLLPLLTDAPDALGASQAVLFNGLTEVGDEDREKEQANLTANHYSRGPRLDQEQHIGLDYQRSTSNRNLRFAGRDGFDRETGSRVTGQLFLDEDPSDECFFEGQCQPFDPSTGEFTPFILYNFWERPSRETEVENLAAFYEHSLSSDRFFLSLGARWESTRAHDDTGRVLTEDESFAPRVSLKIDPKKDGRTLITAAWSRLLEPFPQRLYDDFTSFEPFSGYSEYDWNPFGDPACDDEDPSDLGSPCWEIFGTVPLFPRQGADPNPDLERSFVDETTFGFEHQLSENTGLRLNYIRREWKDLWDDLLTVDPDGFGVSELANLPQARRKYQAAQILIQRRRQDRWQLLASYTWSEALGNLFVADGFSTFADFTDAEDTNSVNRFGRAPYDSRNQIKGFISYRLPLGPNSLPFGSVFQLRDGTPYQQERFEGAGIRFLTRRGALELEQTFQWDLSARFDWPLANGSAVEFKFEVFNVTDEQERSSVEQDIDSGRFGLPREVGDLQPPRSLRFSLGYTF